MCPMTIFFTSIGFGASIKILKLGGPMVIKFLLIASVLCVLQNILAVALAGPVGVEPGLALMTGSTPMTGGHGTSALFMGESLCFCRQTTAFFY